MSRLETGISLYDHICGGATSATNKSFPVRRFWLAVPKQDHDPIKFPDGVVNTLDWQTELIQTMSGPLQDGTSIAGGPDDCSPHFTRATPSSERLFHNYKAVIFTELERRVVTQSIAGDERRTPIVSIRFTCHVLGVPRSARSATSPASTTAQLTLREIAARALVELGTSRSGLRV